jgi:asparagine N-glycosylation enzyme membrane subunit Stt3
VFLINLIPLHVLALMITGRFSHRVYVAYSTVYTIGTILSMQISFVGFQPVQSSEHMLAFGVFGLCQLHALVDFLKSKLTKEQFDVLFKSIAIAILSIFLGFAAVLTLSGKGECNSIKLPLCSSLFFFSLSLLFSFSMDRTFLFPLGPVVCQKSHPYYRLRVRASTDIVELLLL